jgi:microcystin-dependent protein
MSAPFLGEIRLFAGNFAIHGWAFCNGAILPISQNAALFSILGTNYGGNGTSTFALPNLQGANPVGAGSGVGLTPYSVGENGGSSTVTLTPSLTPNHNHPANAVDGFGQSASPGGHLWAKARVGRAAVPMYSDALTSPASVKASAVQPIGGNGPHNNLPPVLAVTFIIALTGLFPSRN